ncbi:MAG: hypothetical protein RBT75_03485 [Anaerolineae bacterium]|nr:hypothetical protein [Anaerolineae bacterium]
MVNATDLPEYLPLEQAAEQYRIDPELLRRAVDAGAVEAGEARGQIIVAVADVVLVAAQVCAAENDELVSLNEAAKRLEISSATVLAWHRHGWLPVLDTGSRNAKLISWSRARAIGKLYHERRQLGSRLIPRDKDLLRLGLI